MMWKRHKRLRRQISAGTRALRERKLKRVEAYDKRLQERIKGVAYTVEGLREALRNFRNVTGRQVRVGVASRAGINWRAGK
jgi:hypothetical protein